jgi:SAM-dependent methyltransferase
MSSSGNHSLTAGVERFSGYAPIYDEYRPQPPGVVVEILTQLAQAPRPALVVDVGCGTGLSTRIWAGRAKRVIGIDPSADMLGQAVARTSAEGFEYRLGFSHQTGLGEGCADIVTCSQSLHWMEPASTLNEVARILRPGGVFAAIDCDWPPTTPNWEADEAYRQFTRRIGALEKQRKTSPGLARWSKNEHLARIQACGHFRFTREVLVHGTELGSAERLVGLAMSLGSVESLLKAGLNEADLGLDEFRAAARRMLGEDLRTWYFSYRVRVGIK